MNPGQRQFRGTGVSIFWWIHRFVFLVFLFFFVFYYVFLKFLVFEGLVSLFFWFCGRVFVFLVWGGGVKGVHTGFMKAPFVALHCCTAECGFAATSWGLSQLP